VSKSNAVGRISLTARIGLTLVLIPLASLGGCSAWDLTRVWEPLNIPISLARGHFRLEFDLNVESPYAVRIELNITRELGCRQGPVAPIRYNSLVTLVIFHYTVYV
jgi:hypothetical protein